MPTIPNEIDFTFVDIKKKPQHIAYIMPSYHRFICLVVPVVTLFSLNIIILLIYTYKKPQQPLLTRLLELQINKHLNYTNKHYVFHINIKN